MTSQHGFVQSLGAENAARHNRNHKWRMYVPGSWGLIMIFPYWQLMIIKAALVYRGANILSLLRLFLPDTKETYYEIPRAGAALLSLTHDWFVFHPLVDSVLVWISLQPCQLQGKVHTIHFMAFFWFYLKFPFPGKMILDIVSLAHDWLINCKGLMELVIRLDSHSPRCIACRTALPTISIFFLTFQMQIQSGLSILMKNQCLTIDVW